MTDTSAFEIEESPRRNWARLVCSGELDASTALTFRRRLRTLRAANTHVYIDLSQLEFIDCAGARALSDALAEARRGSWRVEVAPGMSDQASRLFDLLMAAGVPAEL
ncbi:MAG: STAS domain-containing protein [Candidatus Woesearchaeota archaeon]